MQCVNGSASLTSWTNQLEGPAGWTSWTDQLDGPAGRTSWTYQLDEPAGRTSWTDQLDRSAGRTSWTDHLDVPAGQTSWTDQLDGPAGRTSSFYLKPWPVRIFEDYPFSLYIVAASESDEGLVFGCQLIFNELKFQISLRSDHPLLRYT